MKKFLSSIVSLTMLVSLVAFTGCGSKGSTSSGESTIKLGLLTPTTGKVAVYGQAVEKAAELAVKKYNDDGGILGKQIELVVYDTKADGTETINAFNRMINNDKIHLSFMARILPLIQVGEELPLADRQLSLATLHLTFYNIIFHCNTGYTIISERG